MRLREGGGEPPPRRSVYALCFGLVAILRGSGFFIALKLFPLDHANEDFCGISGALFVYGGVYLAKRGFSESLFFLRPDGGANFLLTSGRTGGIMKII